MLALDLYKHLSTLELAHQYTNEWRKKSMLSEVNTIGELKSHVQMFKLITFSSYSEW